MGYKEFFGFQDDPFRLTPDTEYFFPSHAHQGALEALRYFFSSHEGFALIVGEAGTGKTLLLRIIMKNLPPHTEVALVLSPNLDPTELLTSILRDLGLEKDQELPREKDQLIKLFNQYLLGKVQERKKVVIVIDEAQNLPTESLEQLRLLSNLETEKEKLLQILLVGQPELLEKIKDRKLRQLDQRITIKEELHPFSQRETEEYILFRLSRAGKGNVSLGRGVLKEVHRLAEGIPRKINAILSRALLLAYAEDTHILDRGLIMRAYQSVSMEETKKGKNLPFSKALLVPTLLVLLALVFSFIYGNGNRPSFLYRALHKSSPPSSPSVPPQKSVKLFSSVPSTHPSPERAENTDPSQALYEKGLEFVRSGQLEEGRKVLKKFLILYPHHTLADNALYWLGESYFSQKDWKKAEEYFSQVLKSYPQGNKAPYALYKRAITFLRENKLDRARADLHLLLKEYPHSQVAQKAQRLLGALDGGTSSQGKGVS